MESNGFNIPSPDDLRAIHQSVPELAHQYKKRQRRALMKKSGVMPGDRFCEICFHKIVIVTKTPSPYCADCGKELKDGMTAIVSMDGRFSFIQSTASAEQEKDMFVAITGTLPKVWPENFTIRGCVLPTSGETMDHIIKMFESKNAAPQN